ncbi:MAG: GNAT family N-acetyltransferase [Firmicutes bacterium]|nr:GNAT family N-acetyltransferase [Bacillota bacterium]
MTLEPVTYERKSALRNLLELFLYDLSEFEDEETDVNECGLYEYEYLDHYWTQPGRYAYFIRVRDKLAGFALISQSRSDDGYFHTIMEEFFVMRRYRGQRVGQTAAHRLFSLFPGCWRIPEMRLDIPAQRFWRKIIPRYTGGQYVETEDPDWQGPIQEFWTVPWAEKAPAVPYSLDERSPR